MRRVGVDHAGARESPPPMGLQGIGRFAVGADDIPLLAHKEAHLAATDNTSLVLVGGNAKVSELICRKPPMRESLQSVGMVGVIPYRTRNRAMSNK